MAQSEELIAEMEEAMEEAEEKDDEGSISFDEDRVRYSPIDKEATNDEINVFEDTIKEVQTMANNTRTDGGETGRSENNNKETNKMVEKERDKPDVNKMTKEKQKIDKEEFDEQRMVNMNTDERRIDVIGKESNKEMVDNTKSEIDENDYDKLEIDNPEINIVEVEKTEIEKMCDQLKKDKEIQHIEFMRLENEKSRFDEVLDELMKDVNKSKEINKKWKSKFSKYEEKNKKMEKEVSDAKFRYKELGIELREWNMKCNQIEKEIAEQKQYFEDLTIQLTRQNEIQVNAVSLVDEGNHLPVNVESGMTRYTDAMLQNESYTSVRLRNDQQENHAEKDKEGSVQNSGSVDSSNDQYVPFDGKNGSINDKGLSMISEMYKKFHLLVDGIEELKANTAQYNREVIEPIQQAGEKKIEEKIAALGNTLGSKLDNVGDHLNTNNTEIRRLSSFSKRTTHGAETIALRVFSADTENGDDAATTKSTTLSSQCSQCGREPTDPGACTRLEGKHLQFISDRITNDWKQLVLAVGLKQYVIDQIEADYTTMAEKAYQGLTRCLQIDAMVSHCWLIELIQSMQRFDIIEELAQTYPELEWVSNSPCTSDYTLQNTTELSMRQAEIEQIREFFKVEQTKHNILVIQGLPGVGTTESKIQAMNDLDQNKIIYPRFHQREKHEKKWTLNELMDVIFQSLRSTRFYIPSNKVHPSIDDILKSIKEPIYLNLEVSNLRMRKGVEFSLWNFLRGLLQRNNLLKIIITSYEYPHQLTLSNTFDIVRLTDFNLSDSVKFLQFHNQSLTEEHCRRIFQCCGGNPLMLKKISLNIQNLHQHKLEIDRFVRELRHNTVNMNWFDSFLGDTFWSNNMNVILEKMDDKSIVVLTKLVVFNDQIPTGSLETIYSDPMVAHEANHLFIHHTICEKIDNKNSRNYRMSTIYRSFLRNFIKNERRLYEHHEEQVALKEIIDDSHERVRQFFLDLLQELATMYNSKCFTNFTTRCENIINEYAGFCSCGDKGYCSSYKSSMAIFQSHELTFLNFIKEPIFPYFTKAFLSKPIEIIQFLRNVISKSELEELKQSQFQLKYVDGMDADRIGRSLAMATFVLLKVQTNQKGFDDINILSRCITTLRHCKDESHRAVLFMCYLNRAEAYAVVAHSRENAQEDILEAKKIYKIDKIKGARLIEYYNTLADIHYHFQEFDESIKYRKLQRDESERSLGVHPLTAKAYYLLGKTQRTNCVCEDTTQCTGNANSAKAKEMFVKMKDELVALDPYLKEDFIVKWCERLGADKSWLFDVPLNSPTK